MTMVNYAGGLAAFIPPSSSDHLFISRYKELFLPFGEGIAILDLFYSFQFIIGIKYLSKNNYG